MSGTVVGATSTDVGIFAHNLSCGFDGIRVIIPVLQRPKRAQIVYESLRASEGEVPLRPVFMLSYRDNKQFQAVIALGADYVVLHEGRRPGDYARKINTGAALTQEPWLFTAADDVLFHSGWAETALAFAAENELRAVGVNDLGRWARHKTPPAPHFLVARSYFELGTIDQPNEIFHTGYDHTYVDTEFMDTAKRRGEYGYCVASVVEHIHPVWRKAKRDEVYQLGQRRSGSDYRLYLERRGLWTTSRS